MAVEGMVGRAIQGAQTMLAESALHVEKNRMARRGFDVSYAELTEEQKSEIDAELEGVRRSAN